MSFTESTGTRVNRYLDSLGMPDSFGDAIGALVDARRGDFGGALRNRVDLQSGLPTRALDSAIQNAGPAFRPGFVPRCTCSGPHLGPWSNTYAVSRQVGRHAHVGQKYNYNVGPFQCQGRITGRQYNGSFSKPIQLKNDQWLFHGRTYNSLNDVARDIRDGRVDGQATTHFRFPTPMVPFLPYLPTLPVGGAPVFPFNPIAAVAGGLANLLGVAQQAGQNIGDVIRKILENGGFNPAPGGSSPSPATGDTGANGASDIMSGPGSLEDKLLLLMAKLADHLDKQIEDQMKKIESEMAKQKQDGKGGAQGGGLGGILGGIGSVAGGIFGGPIGAAAGGAIGNLLSGAAGGSSQGGSSSSSTDKSNLQLLQAQLQQMVERRNQMFQTMTQMLKSLNDTSLSIIRNLKA
ncbi:MAG: hypothetical protein U0527_04110 [Candidatus Eisenbacteria bacterium]